MHNRMKTLKTVKRVNLSHWTILFNGTNRIGSSNPLTWGWKQIQFPKRCALYCSVEYQTMDKYKNPVNSSAVHHRQKAVESTNRKSKIKVIDLFVVCDIWWAIFLNYGIKFKIYLKDLYKKIKSDWKLCCTLEIRYYIEIHCVMLEVEHANGLVDLHTVLNFMMVDQVTHRNTEIKYSLCRVHIIFTCFSCRICWDHHQKWCKTKHWHKITNHVEV
jgi:hypothetical protein